MTYLEAAARSAVLANIKAERHRQIDKWGLQSLPDGTGGLEFRVLADMARAAEKQAAKAGATNWAKVLMEEFYEALAEEDPKLLREELIQVAAVVVAWVEDIDAHPNDR